MVFQQWDTTGTAVPRLIYFEVADAAQRYQRLREIERQHLALMARCNLLAEWTAEIQARVTEARAQIRDARAAREAFREQVRTFVVMLRRLRQPLSTVLRRTRSMMQTLEEAGAIAKGGGWREAEVREWAIEDFEPAA